MFDFLQNINFWYWLGLGAVLLILELVMGSGFLLWIGISAGIVGFLLWLFPAMDWAVQLLGFAGLAMLTAFLWWFHVSRHPSVTDQPKLNRRAEQYVGRIFTLDAPIVNGLGKIRVDDSTWRVRCAELPAGARVKITGVDGVILIAEPEVERG